MHPVITTIAIGLTTAIIWEFAVKPILKEVLENE